MSRDSLLTEYKYLRAELSGLPEGSFLYNKIKSQMDEILKKTDGIKPKTGNEMKKYSFRGANHLQGRK